jgi:hypothetical protein
MPALRVNSGVYRGVVAVFMSVGCAQHASFGLVGDFQQERGLSLIRLSER